MKRILFGIAALLLLGAVILGWRIYAIRRLPTVISKRNDITQSVFASGKTKAEKEAHLAFKSTGRISSLPVKKNQRVTKGQIVATIDTSDLQANLEKDLQDYLKTRWDFDETTKETYRNSITTDTIKRIKEKAQFDLNKSVTDVEIANRALKNASLYAPFDGLVTDIHGEINEWVSAFSTEPLVTITDPSTVYFEGEVEEEDMGRITSGQVVFVTLDAYPEKRFTGTVSEIDQKAIVKSNGDTVIPIKVVLSDQTDLPLAGLNGDAQVVITILKDVLTLPKRAIHLQNGKSTVIIRQGITLQHIEVETGAADATQIEIKNGVSVGLPVILPSALD